MQIELFKIQNMLEWIKTKIFLDAISNNSTKRVVKRGEVYICNLGVGIGSEMQKERPCVIIQNDNRNLKAGNTIVIPISHTNKEISCIIPIEERKDSENKIILDGYVNVSNLICISKARLGSYITTLSKDEMRKIDMEILKTLDLIGYYNKFEKQLKDKELYITKLKEKISKTV